MITVTIDKVGNEHSVTMVGHAGTAPRGYDLVCAGASALCLAMAQVLQENEDKLKHKAHVIIKEGDVSMRWEAKPKYEKALLQCLYAIHTGLRVLAYNHPDCIALEQPSKIVH